MNLPVRVRRLLSPDPIDVGCAETFDCIDRYVELLVLGVDPGMPGVAVHLRDCRPCAEDFEGLLAAVRATGGLVETP